MITDALTGLLNHGAFEAWLTAAVADGSPFSVIMVDLDDFKAVNDGHGHLVGDRILRAVAQTCRRVIREGDVLIRYGGEEFLVLLPGAGRDDIAEIGERIRLARTQLLQAREFDHVVENDDRERAAEECVRRLVEEIAIVQPKMVVVMGAEALEVLNELELPLAREVLPNPGNVQQLTPSIAALYPPNIAEALDAAHAHGVIHRDITPSNVLLLGAFSPLGPEWDRVKAIDFGLSRLVGGDDLLTEYGVSLGPPG